MEVVRLVHRQQSPILWTTAPKEVAKAFCGSSGVPHNVLGSQLAGGIHPNNFLLAFVASRMVMIRTAHIIQQVQSNLLWTTVPKKQVDKGFCCSIRVLHNVLECQLEILDPLNNFLLLILLLEW